MDLEGFMLSEKNLSPKGKYDTGNTYICEIQESNSLKWGVAWWLPGAVRTGNGGVCPRVQSLSYAR